jgi:hypothetical protein
MIKFTAILKYWKWVVMIIAGIVIYLLFIQWRNERAERIRIENNFRAEKLNKQEVQNWTRDEIKAMLPEVVKVARENGIRINQVTEIHNYRYFYKDSTTLWLTDTVINNIHYKVGERQDSCMLVRTITDMANNKQIVDVEIRDSLMTFTFWKRKPVRILFFNLRIGRKHFFQKIISQCPNVHFKYAEQIKVVKEK